MKICVLFSAYIFMADKATDSSIVISFSVIPILQVFRSESENMSPACHADASSKKMINKMI